MKKLSSTYLATGGPLMMRVARRKPFWRLTVPILVAAY
jgi:hypothetical protein